MPEYNILNDNELVSLLSLDDMHAFTEVYNRYWKKLFSIAANKIHDLDDAEEIVQDIFVTLWNRRDKLSIVETLSSYLAVSVKYRVIKLLDKRSNRQKYVDYRMDHVSTAENSTEQWVEFEELKDRLVLFVAELPEKCRLAYQLSRESGYSQKMIAEEMGISEKTVEAHLGKAIRTLRARLSQFLL